MSCQIPPPGWYCTREEGHTGPCAAHLRQLDTIECAGCAFSRDTGGYDTCLSHTADIERLRRAVFALLNRVNGVM